MSRPTKEKIDKARAILRPDEPGDVVASDIEWAIDVMLAATEPPSDEELAEEAERMCPVETYWDKTPEMEWAYKAGARREGRR